MSLVFHGPQSAGELLDVSLGVVKGNVLYANARVRNEGYDVEALLPTATGATG